MEQNIAFKVDNHIDAKNVDLVVSRVMEVFASARVNGVSQKNLGRALDMMSETTKQAVMSFNNNTIQMNLAPAPEPHPGGEDEDEDEDEE